VETISFFRSWQKSQVVGILNPKWRLFFEKIADFEGYFGRDGGFHEGVFIRRFRRFSQIKSF
jgi:hypothetical protein